MNVVIHGISDVVYDFRIYKFYANEILKPVAVSFVFCLTLDEYFFLTFNSSDVYVYFWH